MKSIYQLLSMLLITTFILGLLYPLAIAGIGQIFWYRKSNGSLIKNNDEVIGSELIAQKFTKPKYFFPRPSASNFNTIPSGASNLGPTSLNLKQEILKRRNDLSVLYDIPPLDIPMDLLTTSASGLDPHISRSSALLQLKRIVKARHLSENEEIKIKQLIDEQGKIINVLLLNIGLDQCCP